MKLEKARNNKSEGMWAHFERKLLIRSDLIEYHVIDLNPDISKMFRKVKDSKNNIRLDSEIKPIAPKKQIELVESINEFDSWNVSELDGIGYYVAKDKDGFILAIIAPFE